ncbi:MAG: CPBP family intramembrane metalloprotease [Alphaproteobacteria bacterium]|nr:CPBP family intramembrane metalloprotease [Alphaproteobacteria bacterium]MCB9792211.1 CPBP family intramembrane metalloprotease [Alphaproteobacteria bacterium]
MGRLPQALLAVALVLPAQVLAAAAAAALHAPTPRRLGLLPLDLHPSLVLPGQLALLLLALAFAAGERRALGAALRPRTAPRRALGATAFASLALGQLFLFALALAAPEQVLAPEQLQARAGAVSWAEGLLALTGPVLLAPLGEELLYRGLLQRRLLERLPPAAALPLGAALFAVAHGLGPALAPRFALGLIWGYAAWRTGSLLPGALAHAAFNLVLVGWSITLPFPWLSAMGPEARRLGLCLSLVAVALGLSALRGSAGAARRYTPGHALSPALHPRQA